MNKIAMTSIVVFMIGAGSSSFGMTVGYDHVRPYRTGFKAPIRGNQWNEARSQAIALAGQDLCALNREDALFKNALEESDNFAPWSQQKQEREKIDVQQNRRYWLLSSLPHVVAQQKIAEESKIMLQRLDEAEKQEIKRNLDGLSIDEKFQQSFFENLEKCKENNLKHMATERSDGSIDGKLSPVWVRCVKKAMDGDGLNIGSINLLPANLIEHIDGILIKSSFADANMEDAHFLLMCITEDPQCLDEFVRENFKRTIRLGNHINQACKNYDKDNQQVKLSKKMHLRHVAFHEVAHLVRGHVYMRIGGINSARERSADVHHAVTNPKAAQCARFVGSYQDQPGVGLAGQLYPGSYPYLAVADTNWKFLEKRPLPWK